MADVAIMIPGVRLADIRRASRLLEEDRLLRRANDAVVEFMLVREDPPPRVAKAQSGAVSAEPRRCAAPPIAVSHTETDSCAEQ
jgi:hypothetical protein